MVDSGRCVLVLGESGSGKTTVAKSVMERTQHKNCAIAHPNTAKRLLQSLANQLGIPTKNENDKDLSNEDLKDEIYANVNSDTLIVADNADRWSPTLRYWLDDLQKKGVRLILTAIEDPRKDIFLRAIKVELSAPIESQIREVMYREAIACGIELSPNKIARLQQLAGSNLMLAKKVIQEAALGLHQDAGEHTQYVDVSPFIGAALTGLGIVRFLGLGMGDRSLYVFGGIAMLLAISLRYLGRGFNQKPRRLGK